MPEFKQKPTWVTNLSSYQFTRGENLIIRLTTNKPQYIGKIWMERTAYDMKGVVLDSMCSLHCEALSRDALYDFWPDLDQNR